MNVETFRGAVTATTLSAATNTSIRADVTAMTLLKDRCSLHMMSKCFLGSYPAILMVSIPHLTRTYPKSTNASSRRSLALMEFLNMCRENTASDKIFRIIPTTNRTGLEIFHITATVETEIFAIVKSSPKYSCRSNKDLKPNKSKPNADTH